MTSLDRAFADVFAEIDQRLAEVGRVEKIALRPIEAARALSISRTVIYELVHSGALPSFKLGTSIRIPVEGLRAWVAERVEAERREREAAR